MIRPRELPKLRNQLLRHLADPAAPLRANTGPEHAPGLDALARHLRAAELYWVAAPMAALAVHAGAQLDQIDAAPDTRPSGCGLIVYQDGVGDLPLPRGWGVRADGGRPMRLPIDSVPVTALTWGPYEGHVLVWALVDRALLADVLDERGMELDRSSTPPLVPMVADAIPVSAGEPLGDTRIPQPVIRALVASWHMMQQPLLTDRSTVRPDKKVRGVTTRLGMPDPQVTLVDLRRQYVPDDRGETGVEGGRRYRYRWVVSGHWRSQPYGPGRTLRRKRWIPAYVKGPAGAPLLVRERVNVWRR